jgi:hypothetical protein
MHDQEGKGGFGDNVNDTLSRNNTLNLDVELPAAAKIMRDIAFVSVVIKMAFVFYMISGVINSGKITRFSAESTLRQLSTLGLLLSSSYVWAHPIHDKQVGNDGQVREPYHVMLFWIAVGARIFDMVQDVYVHCNDEDYANTLAFLASPKRKEDEGSASSIESARVDNPRSWFVIVALGTTLGMLIKVGEKGPPGGWQADTHVTGCIWSATVFLIVHLLVALYGVVAPSISIVGDDSNLRYLAVSRSPVIRLAVTTTTLVVLGMLVAEVGFPGTEGTDQYGVFKATGDQKADKITVTEYQWNALGALLSYVVADSVGHVFL